MRLSVMLGSELPPLSRPVLSPGRQFRECDRTSDGEKPRNPIESNMISWKAGDARDCGGMEVATPNFGGMNQKSTTSEGFKSAKKRTSGP